MPVTNLKHRAVPPSLLGAVACDSSLIPRFWATVWVDGYRARLAMSYNKTFLVAIDALYQTAESVIDVSLDQAIARADYEALRTCLGAHLQKLNNSAVQRGVDLSQAWNVCLAFIEDVLEHVSAADDHRWEEIKRKLSHIQAAYAQLAPSRSKDPLPIRALPARVIEELYGIFDPESGKNPFRTKREKVRNFLIFLILLHLGLRRGELLTLQVDAFHDEYDAENSRIVYWLVVDSEDADDLDDDFPDPRASKPSLKNDLARRILPVGKEIVALKDLYLGGYRRRSSWGYLFTSQKGLPLSSRRVNQIFEVATELLSQEAKAALRLRGKENVQPHDLRHTCAVRRLTGYRKQLSHTEAVEKLRVFFGWEDGSAMPARYARAYYETDYDTVWQDRYDIYVDAIRDLEGTR